MTKTEKYEPSKDELLSAAEIMETVASGHCSFGSVPKDLANKRRRIAEWLIELALKAGD